ncbi:MAG: hypothetical protein JOY93_01470, partial [Acidobacteriales bacterium]|nr:hypothetical protein [Terriglobales bacterium]
YRNPVEFANGPYSAQAIEQRSSAEGHPGAHSVHTAFSYFLKAAELNLSGEASLQKVWIALALVGAGWALRLRRRLWILLLFGAPLIFYIGSVAYGGLPIYLPMWWPHTFYNTRYGLELLPAFSVLVGVTSIFLMTALRGKWTKALAVSVVVVFIGVSYGLIWREQGIGFREAWSNSRDRIAFEGELAANLIKLPADSTLLMDLRDYVGAVQRAGVPLRRVIHEGNHRVWKQPQDADGLWERALADPAKYADYAVAFAGDPVDEAIKRESLFPLVVIHSSAHLTATIYWTRRIHGNQ